MLKTFHQSDAWRTNAVESWDWPAAADCCQRVARRILGAGPDAEDAAQDALSRIWRARMSCARPERPEAWWSTIAEREALRVWAARKRLPALLDAEAWLAVDHDGSERDADKGSRLDVDALRQLAPQSAAVIFRRFWADHSHAEIAAALGISEAATRVRLHRALHQLRTVVVDS